MNPLLPVKPAGRLRRRRAKRPGLLSPRRSLVQPAGPSRHGLLSKLECWLLRRLLRALGSPSVTVALPSGREIAVTSEAASARIRIRNRRTLWRLLANPEFQFGEAYASGDLEFEGAMAEFLTTLSRLPAESTAPRSVGSRVMHALRGLRRNTISRSKHNIHHHYDIGNNFYRLWLDGQMVYTCAYFAEPSYGLEHAQVAKMDHVCRKLRLQPGETVLEAGCGWGALALHMAREYGVKVWAFNISQEQIAYAREQAEQADLGHQVEFVEDDWRNMTRPCDAFVSIGMLEHIGPRSYRRLGDVMDKSLSPGGRGLIHTIARNQPRPLDAWIERRIFPGAYVPTLREMMDLFEPHNFTVLDVENIGPHYAETIRHWLDRYEQSAAVVRDMFDEPFVRMWRLYLAGSYAGFASGDLQLFQVLFARGPNHPIPPTRAHLYTKPRAAKPPNTRTAKPRP